MQPLTAFCAVLALLAPATAHMSLSYPAPFRAAVNPNVPESAIDFTPTAPLSGASQFPCKGYQVDVGTAQGKATAQWQAGNSYNFTVLGSAVHGGGSSQLGISNDKGKTWKVIHSYLGSNPNPNPSGDQTFDFTLPSDTPVTGSDGTIFAWLWYNVVGNREIYMSCASVDITAGSSTRSAPAVAFSSRPDLFVANLANGCVTVEGKEVQFPNPGPSADVTVKPAISDNSGSFTGTCAAVNGIGGESGSSSLSPSSGAAPAASIASTASSVASSIAPSSEQPTTLATSATSLYSIPGFGPSSSSSSASLPLGGVFATASSSPVQSTAAVPSASSSPVESSAPSPASSAPVSSGTGSSSGLAVSDNGSCGPSVATCGTLCCSSYGFCGSTDSYCGTGCQEGFGQCGSFLNSTSSTVPAPTGAKFRIRN